MKKILNAILSYILFWVMYFLGLYAFKIRNKVKIVGKENKKFVPTELGIKITNFLNEQFPQIMDYNFTSKL